MADIIVQSEQEAQALVDYIGSREKQKQYEQMEKNLEEQHEQLEKQEEQKQVSEKILYEDLMPNGRGRRVRHTVVLETVVGKKKKTSTRRELFRIQMQGDSVKIVLTKDKTTAKPAPWIATSKAFDRLSKDNIESLVAVGFAILYGNNAPEIKRIGNIRSDRKKYENLFSKINYYINAVNNYHYNEKRDD